MDTIGSKSSGERFRFPFERKMDQTFPASTFFEQIFCKGLDRGFNLEYVKTLMVMPCPIQLTIP
jgi:hypothetical protein